jgi:cyclopropane fatty-acyl-phospholipid synthase-like methyltransferase
MENINDSYFDGYYKDLWRSIIPEELTIKEVDFMLPYFHLQPGSKVLDLMCGYGRHAIALAKKGMEVTAVDNLEEYIIEVRESSDKEQLPLKAIQADVMKYKPEDVFDLVLCMGNSLNFFNPGECQELLSHISSRLRSGGHLLINSWSIAEIAIRQFKDKTWSTIDDKKFIVESQYLFHPTRIESEHLILAPNGNSETKKGIDYIYSIAEMESMLNKAGLQLGEIFSIPGKKKFTVGEPRAYIIAEKP